ncbi:hypothetical protein BS78_02G306500 [Paspalum vaginatum]|nr:hypothetical protein BS78_02G306500 [Paspalum vaginatum]
MKLFAFVRRARRAPPAPPAANEEVAAAPAEKRRRRPSGSAAAWKPTLGAISEDAAVAKAQAKAAAAEAKAAKQLAKAARSPRRATRAASYDDFRQAQAAPPPAAASTRSLSPRRCACATRLCSQSQLACMVCVCDHACQYQPTTTTTACPSALRAADGTAGVHADGVPVLRSSGETAAKQLTCAWWCGSTTTASGLLLRVPDLTL